MQGDKPSLVALPAIHERHVFPNELRRRVSTQISVGALCFEEDPSVPPEWVPLKEAGNVHLRVARSDLGFGLEASKPQQGGNLVSEIVTALLVICHVISLPHHPRKRSDKKGVPLQFARPCAGTRSLTAQSESATQPSCHPILDGFPETTATDYWSHKDILECPMQAGPGSLLTQPKHGL